MVLLDRATVTLYRLSNDHVYICSGWAAILNAALLPADVTHRIVSLCWF